MAIGGPRQNVSEGYRQVQRAGFKPRPMEVYDGGFSSDSSMSSRLSLK